jgi:predicted GIY-YIG superfamily endonuclease
MVNYGETIIYKLCCKNPEIKNIYVGHTTNFRRRKWEHKSDCENENKKCYNFNVYSFIRENGSFDNWDMIQIEKYPCENKLQAHQRERYWIENLNANLNCSIPTRSDQEYKKIYYDENRDGLLDKQKKYREQNRDKILEKSKMKKVKVICECGCEIFKHNMPIHLNTKKHSSLMKIINDSKGN